MTANEMATISKTEPPNLIGLDEALTDAAAAAKATTEKAGGMVQPCSFIMPNTSQTGAITGCVAAS